MAKPVRIALTGFMGVGKSSVARHLGNMLACRRVDLDHVIEARTGRISAEIIDADGIDEYRRLETEALIAEVESPDPLILSLGGGTWTVPENREIIKKAGFTTVWLESSFDHCWYNIKFSKKDRPLARSKSAAIELFEERKKHYSLADVHFVIRPEYNSYDTAAHLAEEFC
ncbi:MAG: shikimate kinase [Acidobacteriota bacterium]